MQQGKNNSGTYSDISDKDIQDMLRIEDIESLRKYLFPTKKEAKATRKEAEQKRLEKERNEKIKQLMQQADATEKAFLIKFLNEEGAATDVVANMTANDTGMILASEDDLRVGVGGYYKNSGIYDEETNPNQPDSI